MDESKGGRRLNQTTHFLTHRGLVSPLGDMLFPARESSLIMILTRFVLIGYMQCVFGFSTGQDKKQILIRKQIKSGPLTYFTQEYIFNLL